MRQCSQLHRDTKNDRVLFSTSLFILTAIVLLWNTVVRHNEFTAQQKNLATNSVSGAARQITLQVNELKRSVRLFAERELHLLKQIAKTPESYDIYDRLVEKLKTVFPTSFAATLTDIKGNPYIEDFDGFIVEACKIDIRRFASDKHQPGIYIHPNPFVYHYDVMVPINLEEFGDAIFFINFKPVLVSRILADFQLFNHSLLLLKQDRDHLVEVTHKGSRHLLKEEQFFLNNKEKARILHSVAVANTAWNLVDIPDEELYPSYFRNLWIESGSILAFLLLIYIVITKQLVKSEREIVRKNTSLSNHSHALQKNKDKLERSQQIAHLGHWDYNLITEGIKFSDGASQIFNYSKGDNITAEMIMASIEPKDRMRTRLCLANAIIKKRPYKIEIKIARRDGSIRTVYLLAELTADKDQNPLQLFGIVQDITERKEYEVSATNALLAQREAEAASDAKSAFLANMSHEIRTPLTAIIGFAESLLGQDQSAKEKLSAIRTIIRNGEHLLQVINDILDVSKIEANKLDVERIYFSPISQLLELELGLLFQAKAKGLDFRINYHFPLPKKIHSEQMRIKQILINLISNAVKFTDSGYVHIHVGYNSNTNQMFYEVADTGIGMTEGQVQNIFEPFTQADYSTTRKYGGTGLGLSLCKQLSELLGGMITVDSKPGFGSHFLFSVDCGPKDKLELVNRKEDLPKLEPLQKESKKQNLKGNILLAEDCKDIQQLLSIMLRKVGAKVRVVENGKQAVEVAINHHFDLVLMDMQMPEMSGLEALKSLRRGGYKTPIVMLTANVLKQDKLKCLHAGCNNFITKPIKKENFFEILSQYLVSDLDNDKNLPIVSSKLGEDEKIDELIRRFITSLSEHQEHINNAIKEMNWDNLTTFVHKLKGSSGCFGFERLFEICVDMEFHLSHYDYSSVESQLIPLNGVCERIHVGSKLECDNQTKVDN